MKWLAATAAPQRQPAAFAAPVASALTARVLAWPNPHIGTNHWQQMERSFPGCWHRESSSSSTDSLV
jgi:hypothetical protein